MSQAPTKSSTPLKTAITQLCIIVLFSIAFAYIESAVVVYLRQIFYPGGFTFPLADFGVGKLWRRLLLTEIGREAATMIVILTTAFLFGKNRQQRFAFFLIIFAVWDIFYYIWLKVLIDWPASIMDWDILFLMPTIWASPVLAPVLASLTMLLIALTILHRQLRDNPIKITSLDLMGFILATVIVIISFCLAGVHSTEPDYQRYFSWLLFALGHVAAVALFLKCLLKSQ